MSEARSDDAALDQAYADGKLVGFFGLATSAGCPYVGDQIDMRIAWLDGFAYGSWEASNLQDDPGPEFVCGLEGDALAYATPFPLFEADDRAITAFATAHLLGQPNSLGRAHRAEPGSAFSGRPAGATNGDASRCYCGSNCCIHGGRRFGQG